jgi:hypothetical protein
MKVILPSNLIRFYRKPLTLNHYLGQKQIYVCLRLPDRPYFQLRPYFILISKSKVKVKVKNHHGRQNVLTESNI